MLFLDSIARATAERQKIIDACTEKKKPFEDANSKISEATELYNFFNTNYENSDVLLLRLSAFLREDEYTDDSFFESSTDELSDIFKIKQELVECGRIELNKLCHPKLNFSMDMANIYALPEFDPIVDQFQLGKLIKIEIRKGYVRRSRLMQVNINFEDFSDFSCEFGELTSLISQSDIHADLLSQAVQAGKSVASNASYWNKGSDTSIKLDSKIQQGLLDAATAIKSIDDTQNVVIDKYGIHLQKKDPDTGEIDDKQGWIVNNQFLYSDDAFKTTKSVFGEYSVGDKNYWGLLAEAVIAGYIEGSQIKGGIIQIGDLGNDKYSFEVDEDGNVSMLGGEVKFSKDTNSLGEAVIETKSTIEKTADEIRAEVSSTKTDLEGQISETNSLISQTAGEIRTEVNNKTTDLQGQINTTNSTISQTASQIRSEVSSVKSGLEGQISETNSKITQTAGEIRSEVDSKTKGLQGQIDTANSKITQNANGITAEVTRATGVENGLNSRLSTAEQKITADAIVSTVTSSQTYKNNLNSKANQSDLTNLTNRVSSAEQKITADAIVSTVTSSQTYKNNLNSKANQSDVSNLTNRVSTAEQKITSDAIVSTVTSSSTYKNNLNSKVSSNSIISTINQSAESISISANKINLHGLVTANSNFKILTDGSIEAKNAKISGSITATSGVIGGCTIDSAGKLQVPSANITGTLTASQIDATNLHVKAANIDGTITATSISASNITAGTNSSAITFNGSFTAPNATITGNITATTGNIGGWVVGDFVDGDGRYTNSLYRDTGNYRVFLRSDYSLESDTVLGIKKYSTANKTDGGTYMFYIQHDGYLVAKSGSFSRDITIGGRSISAWMDGDGYISNIKATSGSIGGWNISTSYISGTSGSYTVSIKPSGCSAYNSSYAHDYTSSWYNIVQAGNSWANSSSDLNIKNSISSIDSYDVMFDNLKPCRYKYNYGTSNRYHTGFIAQEVVSAIESAGLTTQDFAGVIHLTAPDENGSEWMLRRDEFVALNTWQIQKLKHRVAELEDKIKKLEQI